jgi:exodeoxyribonuclease-3
MIEDNWVDLFRHFYPNQVKYTWWSYFGSARTLNLGWRIDYGLVKKDHVGRIKKMDILDQIWGSDHCPIEVVFDNESLK